MPRHLREPGPSSDPTVCKDLRSHRRPRNRQSKQSAKYYGYRGVHPSWLNQPYIDVPWTMDRPSWEWSSDPLVGGHEAKVSQWTKADMWLERDQNIWPLDRRHHVGKRIREKRSSKWDELALGRRMRQRNREWEFAVDDARDLARLQDDDADTVCEIAWEVAWELEQRKWDNFGQILDGRGDMPPLWMDLDGERFTDPWFKSDGTDLEQIADLSEVAVNEAWEDGLVCVEGVAEDEDAYSLIYESDCDDDLSVWVEEDGYEMVELD